MLVTSAEQLLLYFSLLLGVIHFPVRAGKQSIFRYWLLFNVSLLVSAHIMPEAEECANGFPDLNFIATKAMKTTTGQKLTDDFSLLNAFTCEGTLTGLVLGVDVRTETASRCHYPEISLWRPEPDEEEDEEYEFVKGSKRTVRLTAANFSTGGAFDYALDVPLDFRANDILGWTQPDDKVSVVRMYTIDGSELMLKRLIPDHLSSESFRLEDPDSSKNVLLLYPVTSELQLLTCMPIVVNFYIICNFVFTIYRLCNLVHW